MRLVHATVTEGTGGGIMRPSSPSSPYSPIATFLLLGRKGEWVPPFDPLPPPKSRGRERASLASPSPHEPPRCWGSPAPTPLPPLCTSYILTPSPRASQLPWGRDIHQNVRTSGVEIHHIVKTYHEIHTAVMLWVTFTCFSHTHYVNFITMHQNVTWL